MFAADSAPVEIAVSVGIGVVNMLCFAFAGQLYSACIEELLKKSRAWFAWLMGCVAIMLFMTALFSWVLGLLGYEVTYLDGEIVLREGAIYRNLGIVCFLNGASIALALLKYLWGAIRRRNRFSFAFTFLELLFGGALFAGGYYLYQDERVIRFGEQSGMLYLAALALSVILAVTLLRSALRRR